MSDKQDAQIKWLRGERLLPCPFCGRQAEIMANGLVGCLTCAIVRRDAASWNRRHSNIDHSFLSDGVLSLEITGHGEIDIYPDGRVAWLCGEKTGVERVTHTSDTRGEGEA